MTDSELYTVELKNLTTEHSINVCFSITNVLQGENLEINICKNSSHSIEGTLLLTPLCLFIYQFSESHWVIDGATTPDNNKEILFVHLHCQSMITLANSNRKNP